MIKDIKTAAKYACAIGVLGFTGQAVLHAIAGLYKASFLFVLISVSFLISYYIWSRTHEED